MLLHILDLTIVAIGLGLLITGSTISIIRRVRGEERTPGAHSDLAILPLSWRRWLFDADHFEAQRRERNKTKR